MSSPTPAPGKRRLGVPVLRTLAGHLLALFGLAVAFLAVGVPSPWISIGIIVILGVAGILLDAAPIAGGLVSQIAAILGLGVTVGMIYQAATWELPLAGEDAFGLAVIGGPVWLAAKFYGWVSFVLNDVVKDGIIGALFAIPVCAIVMAFRSPVMIIGYLGLGVLLMLAWGDMIKWEMRRTGWDV